ncbi:MAG TPA: hypothetical protein ENI63_00060 [Candidatus Kaiserbacteria bacterium]|nr:hypothetical protein [Candidatus Kaiserbacteria bacterium]
MSWANRRKMLYGGGVIIFLIVIIGIPSFLFLYKSPTCFDGIKNQKELGIDKGGPCVLLNNSQVQNIAVLWSRSFEVIPGIYNAIAQVDNPNFSAGAINVPYSFKLFDKDSVLISERKGRTYISPNKIISVFEGGIKTGERIPARTLFEFLEEPKWERVDNPIEGLKVRSRKLNNQGVTPRVDAVIENKSFVDIFDIEVIITIFNARDVAIASSRTVIDMLPKQSSKPVTFTWPQKFSDPVSRIDIVPQAPFRK